LHAITTIRAIGNCGIKNIVAICAGIPILKIAICPIALALVCKNIPKII